MAFPTLFSNCAGDATNNCTFTSISGKEIEIFTSKLEHLIKFAENIDGKWHYWLAPHPGFG